MSRKSKAAEFVDEGYTIDVVGRNVLVTDAMRDYAIEKLSKIERLTNRIIDAAITLEVQKLEQRCDIVMKVGHIKIKSHASTDNIYASIDKAVDKLEAQLSRYKNRIQDHHAKPLEAVDMNVNVYRSPSEEILSEVNEDIEEETLRRKFDEYRPREVVSQKKKALKFLTHDEAILKMELSGDAFLIFRSELDRKLKVIYRRKDGNYAIVEPEA